jgi:ABC-2 type transport system ATP-binding protein
MHVNDAGDAVVVSGLSKRYGTVEALVDVHLRVEAGSTVAVLGPNGAGKTTFLEILEGFRSRDAGRVAVLGQDPATANAAFRGAVGVVLQSCEAEPYLTVRELLEQHRRYYRTPREAAQLLELVGLVDRADRKVRQLSGGELRRLDVALALVGHPRLLFLDEPTTGFDPQARLATWEVIRLLQRDGVTIVLTTHYLEEAEQLADRIVVIDGGRVIADATPAELAAGRARRRISFRAPDDVEPAAAPVTIDVDAGRWVLETDQPTEDLRRLTTWASRQHIPLDDLEVAAPRLLDIYLELVA